MDPFYPPIITKDDKISCLCEIYNCCLFHVNFPNSFGKNADLIKHELTQCEMLLLVNIVLILRLWLQCNLNK